jgi:hypothetical protein
MKYEKPFGIADPDAPYINGDPSIGRAGSIPPAAAFENPQREIVGFISRSGIVPDAGDLLQLTKAARSQLVNYGVDTGTANALVVALNPVIDRYFPGLMLRVKVKNNVTGPSTINAGPGIIPIKRGNGAATASGDVSANQIVDLVCDGTVFQIVNFLGLSGPDSTVNNFTIHIPYAADTGPANAIAASFTPPITALAAGDLILVKINHTNTGNVTAVINAMASISVRRVNLAQLAPGDLATGEMALMAFDGTYLQVINQSALYVVPVVPEPRGIGTVWVANGPALSQAEAHYYSPAGYSATWTVLGPSAGTYGSAGPAEGVGTVVASMTQAESLAGYNAYMNNPYGWRDYSQGTYTIQNSPHPPVVLPPGTWICSSDVTGGVADDTAHGLYTFIRIA